VLSAFEVPFGEFLPDFPDYKNPGCRVAHNVVAVSGGYAPFSGVGSQSATASGQVVGGHLYQQEDGVAVTVGGTRLALFVVINGVITETVVPDIGPNRYWKFHQFGRRIFAVGGGALFQLENIDSDTTWTEVAGAPQGATAIGQVGQHLMLGGFLSNSFRIQWSGLNDPINFTPDATNLAGNAELQHEYGAITAIAGDRYPVVFQQYGVSRIDAVGPPTVFNVSTIEEARGCLAPNSVVSVGFITYFMAHDGFWATNGAATQRIGTQKINDHFREKVSAQEAFRTHGVVNWEAQSVIWAYYPAQSENFQQHLIYSWSEDRWSEATLPIDYLVEGSSDGITLDNLDTIYPDLDLIPISLDSVVFEPRGRRLSAFMPGPTGSTLSGLDGLPLEATIETTEFQMQTSERTMINQMYPIVENSAENSVGQLITRKLKGGEQVVTPEAPVNDAGFCPVRGQGLYMSARLVIGAGTSWSKAQGVQLRGRVSGRR